MGGGVVCRWVGGRAGRGSRSTVGSAIQSKPCHQSICDSIGLASCPQLLARAPHGQKQRPPDHHHPRHCHHLHKHLTTPPQPHNSQTQQDAVMLDNVPYGLRGPFAVSLWVRRWPDSNVSGDAFQYLFSHSGIASASAFSPNQASAGVNGGAGVCMCGVGVEGGVGWCVWWRSQAHCSTCSHTRASPRPRPCPTTRRVEHTESRTLAYAICSGRGWGGNVVGNGLEEKCCL